MTDSIMSATPTREMPPIWRGGLTPQRMQTFAYSQFTPWTRVYLGCDPEFFFASAEDGHIMGAERVVNDALKQHLDEVSSIRSYKYATQEAFVIDGVQVELNPRPYNCRAYLGNEIASSMRALKAHLQQLGTVKADFTSVVEVSQAELSALSERARTFGCAPSLNVNAAIPSVKVDASKYKKRAAGGHLHLGLLESPALMAHRDALVPLLDVVVGNTCVLIDRDPLQVERRKHYGRAGEYRLPEHGLEYRTLSNFWLRAYPLMSLVMALARQAIAIGEHSLANREAMCGRPFWSPAEELLSQVDLDLVERAINQNDATLAWPTYQVVRDFFERHTYSTDTGLAGPRLAQFDYFISQIWQQGIESWFPEDPLEHWATLPEGHGCGWEAFCSTQVQRAHAAACRQRWTMQPPHAEQPSGQPNLPFTVNVEAAPCVASLS